MYVDSIKLINFRNYKNLDIKLNSRLNLFIGNNAQGKTNLLESIYICSTGKSYRTSIDKELINLSRDKAYIGIDVINEEFDKKLEIKFERNKGKTARINKVEVDKISDLYGAFNVVIFSPEDLKLVKEGPNQRRMFLDNEISQISPRYRYNLGRYNKILTQRNNLLKIIQYDKSKKKLLDVWNSQLIDVGTEILLKRLSFLKQLSIISKDIHRKITGSIEELDIEYMSSFEIESNDKQKIQNNFLNTLKKNIDKEIERGTTRFGPHRDDIKILVNNIDIRTFGSQGQQRTSALSLKLAEVELIKQAVGEYPVLLLDDVLSELDLNRRKYLVSTFKDIQTIITSTDDIDINEFNKLTKSIYYIKDGKVIETY
ncbi:DNA replication/repair protein RecF [Sporosalibacterium faouarense]|uniref:DNA replication/repair protein RecF n=1 Tax=Sporosalibacterium faouarense TaxID=516123 RepID=UPI00141CB73B|nr:DNA replication/repair protein RecF [Bacillota bacterium]